MAICSCTSFEEDVRGLSVCDVHGHVFEVLLSATPMDLLAAKESAVLLLKATCGRATFGQELAVTFDMLAGAGYGQWITACVQRAGICDVCDVLPVLEHCRTLAGARCWASLIVPVHYQTAMEEGDVSWTILRKLSSHTLRWQTPGWQDLHAIYWDISRPTVIRTRPMFDKVVDMIDRSRNMNEHGEVFWHICQTYRPIHEARLTFAYACTRFARLIHSLALFTRSHSLRTPYSFARTRFARLIHSLALFTHVLIRLFLLPFKRRGRRGRRAVLRTVQIRREDHAIR